MQFQRSSTLTPKYLHDNKGYFNESDQWLLQASYLSREGLGETMLI